MYRKAFIQTLVQIGTVCLRISSLNFCMYMIMGQGKEMTLTFNTHISSHIQLDVCSDFVEIGLPVPEEIFEGFLPYRRMAAILVV